MKHWFANIKQDYRTVTSLREGKHWLPFQDTTQGQENQVVYSLSEF